MTQLPWREALLALFALTTVVQVVYYLYFFRRLAWYRPQEKQHSQQHPVSVIICARDEAANLTKNLPGVLFQQYPSTNEVILVNDNSNDESRYLLAELQKTFKKMNVIELHQEAKLIAGKKYPLSIGIKEAKHEILLLTDADCVPASEHWMQKMQNAYDESTEIVLGYGAYHKKPGLLNKLIRFETLHAAMQYFSFALAGKPYMGVGRNLSYKKQLFFKNKGFSSINHIPGGDDDLFINKVANSSNTRIIIEPDTFTLSEPKKTWKEWFAQKTRHYSTARYYKPTHRVLLGGYAAAHFLFYPLLAVAIIFSDWRIALGLLGIKLITQGIVYYKCAKKLQENDLFAWFWLFDLWMFFYYCIFAPALWKKPRQNWN